jgi:hypothetical protein
MKPWDMMRPISGVLTVAAQIVGDSNAILIIQFQESIIVSATELPLPDTVHIGKPWR